MHDTLDIKRKGDSYILGMMVPTFSQEEKRTTMVFMTYGTCHVLGR
jgi:hypothetical protein